MNFSREAVFRTRVILLTLALISLPCQVLAQGGTWQPKTPMPTARLSFGVGAVNGILYAVGGTLPPNPNANLLATAEAYDPATNTWTTRAPMPTARMGLGVAEVNGILYAIGGVDASMSFSVMEAYDPATNTWTSKAPMPNGRVWFGVAVIDGLIYTVGGASRVAEAVTTVEVYNPCTDSWTTRASMPTARAWLGVGAVNGILYAVGGQRSYLDYRADVEAYDPKTDTWIPTAPLPVPNATLSIGVAGGILYAVGGAYPGGDVVAAVEAFNPATGAWTAQVPMPTARGALDVGVVNGILYALGGCPISHSDTPCATLEAFTPGVSCEEQVAALVEKNNQLQADLDGANASIQTLQNDVTTLTSQLGTVTSGLGSITNQLQQIFENPRFKIPGSTPLEQYQNLVNAILGLNRGRLEGLYALLGGK